MLSKSDYSKLSAAGKKKVKGSSSRTRLPGPRATRTRLRGKGDYWSFAPERILKGSSPFAKVKSAGSGIGSQLGGMLGGAPGRALGGAAHSLFKKITGFGDYKVASNTIMMGTDPPSFATSGRGTIVRHREYIGDVAGSIAFTTTSYPINAGINRSFPWLSQIASNFEQYIVRGMVFEFKSTSADALNSTNTALGAVIMATEYNSVNPNFSSKAQAENHEFCTSAKPSESFLHPIECARGETSISALYTRTGTVPSNTDQRMYDLGNFQIMTVGMQAVAVIGELWVTYDVELLKPRLYDTAGFSFYEDHFRCSTVSATGNYFGTSQVLATGSNLGASVSGSTITFPADSAVNYYFVYYCCVGVSTILANGIALSLGTNVIGVTYFLNDAASVVAPAAGATSNLQTFKIKVVVGASTSITGNTITVTAGTLPTGIVGTDLVISSANPLVVTAPRKSRFSSESDDESASEDEEDLLKQMKKMKKEKMMKELAEWKASKSDSKEEKKVESLSLTPESDEDSDGLDMLIMRREQKLLARSCKTPAPGAGAPIEPPHPGKVSSKK
nr:putative capsid protein [Crucivirus sp.]